MTWLSPLLQVALLQAALLVPFPSASRSLETPIWPAHLSASTHDLEVTQSPLSGGEAEGVHANEQTPVVVDDAIDEHAYLQLASSQTEGHRPQRASLASDGEGENRAQEAGVAESSLTSHEKPASYVELREGVLLNASSPPTPGFSGQNGGTHDKTDVPKDVVFISRGTPGAEGTGTQGTGAPPRPAQVVAQPTGGFSGSMKMEHILPHIFQPFAPQPPPPTGVSGRIVVMSNPSTNASTIDNGGSKGTQPPPQQNNVPPPPPPSADSTIIKPENANQKGWEEDQPLPPPRPDLKNDQNQGDKGKKRDESKKAGEGTGNDKPPHQPPGSGSAGKADDLNFPENATEQLILAELVYRGVGTELLECIEMPSTYHEMDAAIDRHYCLKELWLSTMVPGMTKLSSVMGIPQLHDLGALTQYITNAVTSAEAPETWKHPALESNSCVFAHALEKMVQKQAKSKSKKTSKKAKDAKANQTKNMVQSLSLLLLLRQSHLVEPSMIAFLLSLLDMGNCKNILKKDPPYKVSDKLTVSSKGLFQATLANLIGEAFVVDVRECSSDATAVLGSRASILCPNLLAYSRLRAALHPIVKAVAQSDWEGAKRKAGFFAKNFEAGNFPRTELESTQASVKVYAIMCVSLNFALSSWKGSAAKWVVRQKLLSRLLQKTLGEVAASIFSDQDGAKEFALAWRSEGGYEEPGSHEEEGKSQERTR
ncbi:hypothetical protein Emed_003857 [Eimeria media]